jgi:type I restriction enzyme, S subunit
MLSARNVANRKINFEEYRFISKSDFAAENERTHVQPGDVLLTIVGAIGRIAVVPNGINPFALQRSVAVLKPNGAVISQYLAYAIEAPEVQQFLRANAKGTAQKGIYLKALGRLQLPLAPLAEQQRLSYKLDTVLASLEACRARLDRLPQILKQFREAVLEAAVSGRLTEEWRARQQSQASSVSTYPIAERPDGATILPDGWNWHSIVDLSVKVADGVHKKPEYLSVGVPFITVRDLTAGPGIDFSNTRFISKADHDEFIRRTHPEKGDLLVSKDGTLGVIRLVDTDRPFSIFVSVALIKLKDKSMAKYMTIALEAPVVQKQMVGVGSGLQHIHLQDLRKDVVPLPPPAERNEIVRRVTQLFEFATRLSDRYNDVVAGVALLTPSVLAKAFRGELVPQDPNDEPAGEMLKRLARTGNNAHSNREAAR